MYMGKVCIVPELELMKQYCVVCTALVSIVRDLFHLCGA